MIFFSNTNLVTRTIIRWNTIPNLVLFIFPFHSYWTGDHIRCMQSHIERIETRAFRNLHMSSNTVSMGGIDGPDFKIDEVEQLLKETRKLKKDTCIIVIL